MLKDTGEHGAGMDARASALLARYVLNRECAKGGFCFYHLDEPNGSDTWFALSILNALDVAYDSEKTRSYLYDLQRQDGAFDSLYKAYYAVKSLQLLHDTPTRNATAFTRKHLDKFLFSPDHLPPDITSMFKRLRYLLELMDVLKIKMVEEKKASMVRFLLSFRNSDAGFGYGGSSLSDTAEALAILTHLDYPVSDLKAYDFIRICETETSGFTNIPHTSLYSIEAVNDGLLCATLVACIPRTLQHCLNFIHFCQNKTGGFARNTCTGIATLENSFYAVHALRYAHRLAKIEKEQNHPERFSSPSMKGATQWFHPEAFPS